MTMSSVSSSFGYVGVQLGDNHTMAITDAVVQYTVPVDIFGVYGVASRYVAGGVKIVVVLPSEFSCYTINSTKPCMATG